MSKFFWMLMLAVLAGRPLLTAQSVPQSYVWRNVVIGGGGFVTAIISHPAQKGLMYARTDVGGAYRWDASAQKWIPLTDWMQGVDYTGIESLAVDPSDPNRVFLAAGIYNHTRAAILRSDDQGHTWQQTEVPFKMGGNETGRFNGERLAVDPNDGAILFFGSRHDGLWKSTDRGTNWNRVQSFPKIETQENFPATIRTNVNRRFRNNFTPQAVGIVFLQFDSVRDSSGKSVTRIYAGVSTSQTNFFCSADGGTNWQPVLNQPLGLRPNHAVLSPDGIIYLTYGKEPGPNSMTDGAVWKFNVQSAEWTDITPIKPATVGQPFGYGAIAVDRAHPNTLLATTFCHWQPHDEIFRSTNGGNSWTPLLKNVRWNYSYAPYTKNRTPHWMGSIQIDPFDSNHALFTTGYGIWNCNNLTDADAGIPTQWNFFDDGLEETVPLALISPPFGAHLLSGLGDIDGFRHDDLTISPARGTFAGPHFSSTEDLAFAGKNSQVMVRTGSGGNNPAHAAISTDGGKNWNALASDPPESSGAGTIAISADGKTIVLTPRRGTPNFSVNCGTSWTLCTGLAPGLRVVADAVNPQCFYAFDARAGKFFVSTNGAASFMETVATLPAENGFNGGAALSVVPDCVGNLWLALRDLGLYHSTNCGASFIKIESVQQADSLGFGKAAASQNSPALFLAGKIAGLQALFRSNDAGKNWVRINDDAHQYGVISHVTGDPRIFGRVYFATSGRGIIYGDLNPIRN
jgi:photosystem II stability/assembly factor-like uncharacterized protein